MSEKSKHKRHTASVQQTGLSMMAVQEKLGLFKEQQNHAKHTLEASRKSTTNQQSVLEEKPLSYID
jgi:hypothetical protein